MSLLLGIFYFLVLVGILIFIHEGGHFLAAKLFKVKVEVFSIGMGPRIFGFMKGDTDYRISAVPIGGYVRMLGEDPTAEVDESEGSVAAMAPWKRIVIYAAGPAANLLFPFGLYFFLALGQSTVPPAEIGAVLDNSPAERAGLRTGDRVVAIDGAAIYSFNHMVEVIQRHPGRAIVLTVERDGRTLQVPVVPAPKHGPKYDLPMLRHLRDVKGQIGILGIYPDTIVGVDADSVAARAGLRTFDRVEAVDGQPVERLFDLEKALLSAGGREVSLTVSRLKGKLPDAAFPDAKTAASLPLDRQPDLFDKAPLTIRLSVPSSAADLNAVGLHHSLGHVMNVTPGGPAERAGLRRGDRLMAVDGRPLSAFEIMSKVFDVAPDGKDTVRRILTVERDGARMDISYKADWVSAGTRRDLGLEDDLIDPGFHVRPWSAEWVGKAPVPVANPAPVAYAARMSVSQTLFWSGIILDVLGAVVQGHVSPKSMSGPLGIGQAAAQVGAEGPSAFFGFMGFVSLNLGLLNLLLPIPILDGGRLLLITTEVVTRRRLSRQVQERILLVGAVMVLALMVWAVIMDIARIYLG